MNTRWDETWHRLREWTNGQGPSERLAAQVLLAEGFTNVDPSHPLGGRDGGKDALCRRGGSTWMMAVYFPRGQQEFRAIEEKFIHDVGGARSNGATGIAFITNQELRLSERETLMKAARHLEVELYHLERVTAILDQPSMGPVRQQFLGFGEAAPSVPTVVDKWVNSDYIDKGRLANGLKDEGYRLCWVPAQDEAERLDLEGWEYVEIEQSDGSRARLKVHDSPALGGYVVLLKKRDLS
jgi:hypothetical protein